MGGWYMKIPKMATIAIDGGRLKPFVLLWVLCPPGLVIIMQLMLQLWRCFAIFMSSIMQFCLFVHLSIYHVTTYQPLFLTINSFMFCKFFDTCATDRMKCSWQNQTRNVLCILMPQQYQLNSLLNSYITRNIIFDLHLPIYKNTIGPFVLRAYTMIWRTDLTQVSWCEFE